MAEPEGRAELEEFEELAEEPAVLAAEPAALAEEPVALAEELVEERAEPAEELVELAAEPAELEEEELEELAGELLAFAVFNLASASAFICCRRRANASALRGFASLALLLSGRLLRSGCWEELLSWTVVFELADPGALLSGRVFGWAACARAARTWGATGRGGSDSFA